MRTRQLSLLDLPDVLYVDPIHRDNGRRGIAQARKVMAQRRAQQTDDNVQRATRSPRHAPANTRT